VKNRFLNILFWLVLSAAFIGPGTITTAASAGTDFGFTLLWALLFSTIACIVLQEAASRLTIASGQNLGQAIKMKMSKGVAGKAAGYTVLTAILLGCAAYEAGNILGAVAGTALIFNVSTVSLTFVTGIIAFLLLWFGSTKIIAQLLGVLVALMGLCFLSTAIIMQPDFGAILSGAFVPRLPSGSELLVIGLIGTTVVPYNLFLGSGLKHSQTVSEMRFSLIAAVTLGGIVSMGVLVVGTSIPTEFTYEALSQSLGSTLGTWASAFFGVGLAAAGISSALTAPLAASLTVQSIIGDDTLPEWKEKGSKFKLIWIAVLLIGLTFGMLQVQPVPAIILAQALNGIILPLVTFFLLLMANDAALLNHKHINKQWYNVLMAAIFFITLIIGLTNVAKALTRIIDAPLVNEEYIVYASLVLSLFISWPLIKLVKKVRNG